MQGDGFTSEYVDRLEQGVAEHLHAPYQFEVVTPSRVLPAKAKGFWIKLELFKKDRFDGPVIYLDLDTIIIGDVTEIFTYPHKFTMGTDWNKKRPGPNSTFMAWDGQQDLSHLDTELTPGTLKAYSRGGRWGDQHFIYEKVGVPVTWLEDVAPGSLISYKYHVLRDVPTPNARIVAFHGSPRPHNINWEVPNGRDT